MFDKVMKHLKDAERFVSDMNWTGAERALEWVDAELKGGPFSATDVEELRSRLVNLASVIATMREGVALARRRVDDLLRDVDGLTVYDSAGAEVRMQTGKGKSEMY